MSIRDNKNPTQVDGTMYGGKAPLVDKKDRYCRICGTKLSMYRINTKYCSAHIVQGIRIEDLKCGKDRDDRRYKEKLRYERKKNGKKSSNK
jgi:hypothetical protein